MRMLPFENLKLMKAASQAVGMPTVAGVETIDVGIGIAKYYFAGGVVDVGKGVVDMSDSIHRNVGDMVIPGVD